MFTGSSEVFAEGRIPALVISECVVSQVLFLIS
jgi:hypothetical protein